MRNATHARLIDGTVAEAQVIAVIEGTMKVMYHFEHGGKIKHFQVCENEVFRNRWFAL